MRIKLAEKAKATIRESQDGAARIKAPAEADTQPLRNEWLHSTNHIFEVRIAHGDSCRRIGKHSLHE